MRTVTYRLCHQQVAGAAGVAELQITSKGRIVGWLGNQFVLAAAGSIVVVTEVAVNQNALANGAVNNAPKESTIGSMRTGCLAVNVGVTNTGFIPVNVPCLAGTRLSLNTTNLGTTPTTQSSTVDVYFVED